MYSFPPFLWYPPNSDTPQTFQAQLCAVPRGFFSSCTAHKLFLFMFPPASLKAELRVSSPPPLLLNAACGQGRSSGRVAEIGSHTYVAFMLPQPHDWNPAPCVPVPLFFFWFCFQHLSLLSKGFAHQAGLGVETAQSSSSAAFTVSSF